MKKSIVILFSAAIFIVAIFLLFVNKPIDKKEAAKLESKPTDAQAKAFDTQEPLLSDKAVLNSLAWKNWFGHDLNKIPHKTVIINYESLDAFPESSKILSGFCWISSVADDHNKMAFRCMSENQILDPCFTTAFKGVMACDINPFNKNIVLLKLNKSLDGIKLNAPKEEDNEWGFLLQLDNNVSCSMLTGTRLVSNGTVYPYGCWYTGKQSQDAYSDKYLNGRFLDTTSSPYWNFEVIEVPKNSNHSEKDAFIKKTFNVLRVFR
ncbi:hypothetical protein V4762_02615 [Thermodesulfobium sp. 4217-1]|uniref:hypothetical protein n=1 Tax=Thermodesulfobium sp. 4217-1 TaxID=3120013 RepID=UPI003221C418